MINRAKMFIQNTDKAIHQHFSQLDGGELIYVFSILEKQTISDCSVNLNIELTENAVGKTVSQKLVK